MGVYAEIGAMHPCSIRVAVAYLIPLVTMIGLVARVGTFWSVSESSTETKFSRELNLPANFRFLLFAGDMCNVVGRGATEEFLLPKFFYLCEDGVWGVRKACAECYMTVSSACSQGKRQTDLAPMFVQLLCDQSRCD